MCVIEMKLVLFSFGEGNKLRKKWRWLRGLNIIVRVYQVLKGWCLWSFGQISYLPLFFFFYVFNYPHTYVCISFIYLFLYYNNIC